MYQSQSQPQMTIAVVILAPVGAVALGAVAAVAAIKAVRAVVVAAVKAVGAVALGAKVALAAKVARAEKVDLVALAQEDKAVPQAGAPPLKPLMPLLRTATPRRQLPHQSFQA